jgi:ribosomal protein S18 acetylase RimI-like enzyme
MTGVEAEPPLRFRRPTEADHARIVELVDEWWGGRRMRALLPRMWFRHFTGTSWVVEDDSGRLLGFLVGFISPDHPETAYAHMIATNPNRRRRGIGRALYDQFFADARAAGTRQVQAITSPDNRVSLEFHRHLGFRPDDGPGTSPIYGVPAYRDFDGEDLDRAVLIRTLTDLPG